MLSRLAEVMAGFRKKTLRIFCISNIFKRPQLRATLGSLGLYL